MIRNGPTCRPTFSPRPPGERPGETTMPMGGFARTCPKQVLCLTLMSLSAIFLSTVFVRRAPKSPCQRVVFARTCPKKSSSPSSYSCRRRAAESPCRRVVFARTCSKESAFPPSYSCRPSSCLRCLSAALRNHHANGWFCPNLLEDRPAWETIKAGTTRGVWPKWPKNSFLKSDSAIFTTKDVFAIQNTTGINLQKPRENRGFHPSGAIAPPKGRMARVGQDSCRAHRVLLGFGDFKNHTYTVSIHNYIHLSIGRRELFAARSIALRRQSALRSRRRGGIAGDFLPRRAHGAEGDAPLFVSPPARHAGGRDFVWVNCQRATSGYRYIRIWRQEWENKIGPRRGLRRNSSGRRDLRICEFSGMCARQFAREPRREGLVNT